MAGIGVTLNKLFKKQNLATHILGASYSTVITVAPMFLVIITILIMQNMLHFSTMSFATRNLFSSIVLYMFVFSLLSAAPFNAVLSRYMSDVIYEERFGDILPCFYIGLLINIIFSAGIAIPFAIRVVVVGGVDVIYVFTGYCGYIALVFLFYSMLYLSICKDYAKIALFYLIGMLMTFALSWIFVNWFHKDIGYSMLLALSIGFMVTAVLEITLIRRYFPVNSGVYKPVLLYFKKYWLLAVINLAYILGLYVHNFVFWTTPLHITVAKSFVSAPTYDLATCLAMFTNISMTIVFISQVEMHFRDRYKVFSESIIGGRGVDIAKAKRRMFTRLAWVILALVRMHFIITVTLFLLFMTVMPFLGFSGLVMQIYPSIAAAYFILFVMYSMVIFQYYFNDLKGALMTTSTFCLGTLFGSIFSSRVLPVAWYGMGLFFGAIAAWLIAYLRMRWLEHNLDAHIFCVGDVFKRLEGIRPSGKIFDRRAGIAPPKHEKGA